MSLNRNRNRMPIWTMLTNLKLDLRLLFAFIFEFLHVAIQISFIISRFCFSTVSCVLWSRHKSIRNDVVLITGGGQGIGHQLALEFAKHRPKNVILWGREEAGLREAAEGVEAHNVPCTYMICDVANDEDVQKQANRVRMLVGDVSILVNNAGIVCGKPIVELSMAEIETVYNVNALGQIRVTKAFLPAMLSAGVGHVVSVNSMLGLLAVAGAADYASSKHALTGFMDSLRAELAAANSPVKVTAVYPYLVDTGLFSGSTTRFPWLFPALTAQYVAEQTVAAVRSNQAHLLMPRLMYLAVLCKSLLPQEALLVLYKFAGLDSAMDGFYKERYPRGGGGGVPPEGGGSPPGGRYPRGMALPEGEGGAPSNGRNTSTENPNPFILEMVQSKVFLK